MDPIWKQFAVYFIIFILISTSKTYGLNQEEIELKKWISSLSGESLEYYRKYQPWRLRTIEENIRIGDEERKLRLE